MSNSKKIARNNLVDTEPEMVLPINMVGELYTEDKTMYENPHKFFESFFNQIKSLSSPKIYFTSDLAKLYRVSENTIYNYRKSGKLNCCTDGQKVWFTQEHIDEFNRVTDCRYKQNQGKEENEQIKF